ncbi:MAG: hypothetical protein SFV54_03700 [Bryobacteraceae bacterium]|nr:hypothetical protein [Bryobacteraceae bacterium]
MVAVVLLLAAAAEATLHYDAGGVEVRGVWERPAEGALRVYFGGAETALLGDYAFSEGVLRFRPRFPFLDGREYRAVFSPGGAAKEIAIRFTVAPGVRAPTPRVIRVSPAAATLPANVLRLYIHFSQPMRRTGVGRQIRLEREDGSPVEAALLEMEDGLWDPEGRRLTVFFHPGRIKRGLRLNERMGLPLHEGARYRLVIGGGVANEDGQPLGGDFRHEFVAGPADRRSPAPETWRMEAPRAGTTEALTLISEEPLDEALFARLVSVDRVRGSVRVEDSGRTWRLTPQEKWRAGEYRLRVAAELEDLAGNRPGRLFDEESAEDGTRREAAEVTRVFQVR